MINIVRSALLINLFSIHYLHYAVPRRTTVMVGGGGGVGSLSTFSQMTWKIYFKHESF